MTSDAAAAPAVAVEHVRVRAYFLYLQRGGRSHDPLEDWFQAEREVSSRTAAHD